MAVEAEDKKVVDIQKHILVPKHVILTEEEAANLLEQMNITAVQLPVIFSTDTVAKVIGGKPGQVIKVDRETPTGRAPYYRRIV
jgi:DNA-directed RNA polymerase subunit H (RpoH/RPB5)